MAEKTNQPSHNLDISYYGQVCFGERVSGDLAFFDMDDQWVFLAIIDGLGHGQEAHEVAKVAHEFLSESWNPDVVWTMNKLHEVLQKSRGAAAGLAAIDLTTDIMHYTGIGNTVIRRLGATSSRLVSKEGIVGIRMRSPTEQQLLLHHNDILLLFTDGVSDQFDLQDYPQLKVHSSQLVAKNIVRKFGSRFDDSTCLVLKYAK
ncbi:MAG: stage II sporulation protein E (SpoIIE) [Bacteroidetes bacterium]|nr:MAG: stage II sporulation protein E (SpoIIE) [Bacteroidota bacterium]